MLREMEKELKGVVVEMYNYLATTNKPTDKNYSI
jgi:hypothetical protein